MTIRGVDAYEQYLISELKLKKEPIPFGTRYTLPIETGKGTIESFGDKSRWAAWILDCQIQQSMQFSYIQKDESFIGFAYREGNPPEDLMDIAYPSSDVAEGQITPGLSMRVACVYFFDGFLREYPGYNSDLMDFIRAVQDHDESVIMKHINPALLQMLKNKQTGLGRRIFVESHVLGIMAKLLDIVDKERDGVRKIKLSDYDKERLALTPQILANSIQNPPGIAKLARQIALNEQKLKTGFRQLYGMTIYEYLRRTRMEKAIQMLADDTSIRDVAAQVGYSTLHGFSQTFFKYYGKSPAEWRRDNDTHE